MDFHYEPNQLRDFVGLVPKGPSTVTNICGHAMHRSCWSKYVEPSGKCPVCKSDVERIITLRFDSEEVDDPQYLLRAEKAEVELEIVRTKLKKLEEELEMSRAVNKALTRTATVNVRKLEVENDGVVEKKGVSVQTEPEEDKGTGDIENVMGRKMSRRDKKIIKLRCKLLNVRSQIGEEEKRREKSEKLKRINKSLREEVNMREYELAEARLKIKEKRKMVNVLRKKYDRASGRGKFFCRVCEKPFAHRQNRDRHQKTVHDEQFECEFCGKSMTNRLDTVNRHKEYCSNQEPGGEE